MSKVEKDTDKDSVRIQLSELYLARKVSMEMIRDCSVHTSARLNYSFIMEIVSLIYKAGIPIEQEVQRLVENNDKACAEAIESFHLDRLGQVVRDSILVKEGCSPQSQP